MQRTSPVGTRLFARRFRLGSRARALLYCAALGCSEIDEPLEVDPSPLRLVEEDPSDTPIADLDAAALARFADGDARFEHPFRESQGLGPFYIHRSCVSCHEADGRGPGTVQRIVHMDNGAIVVEVVRPRSVGGARIPVDASSEDAHVELRLGPAVFARGYLEAISDETILAYEHAQSTRDDGIHGRAHRVTRTTTAALPDWLPQLGRFGHKARIATLPEFVADALVSDMGLTSVLRPLELENAEGLVDDAHPGIDITEEEVDQIAEYVRLLARPAVRDAEPRGAALFEEVRCAVCHVPTVETMSEHPIASLCGVTVALFTDLLLHDMGDGLADRIPEGDAGGRDFRTAPLIGLRHQARLLHDGRAEDVETAIRLHGSSGSEANDALARFDALEASDRSTLVRYVEGL